MRRTDKWWAHELERRDRWWMEQLDRAHATIAHLAGQPLPEPEPFDGIPKEKADQLVAQGLATWAAVPEQYPDGEWE